MVVTRWCRKVRGLPRSLVGLVRGYPMTAGFVLLFAYITLVGGLAYTKLADNDSQFCEVTAQRLVDKEDQVAQSKEYLASQAGQEPSGFNVYIRVVAQPRLKDEIRSDHRTLPADCRDEYDRLKKSLAR